MLYIKLPSFDSFLVSLYRALSKTTDPDELAADHSDFIQQQNLPTRQCRFGVLADNIQPASGCSDLLELHNLSFDEHFSCQIE